MAGYSDGTIRVFSISRTEMELKMHPHATALTAIAYSTDGEVACCYSRDVALVLSGLPKHGSCLQQLAQKAGPRESSYQWALADLSVEHMVNGFWQIYWQ